MFCCSNGGGVLTALALLYLHDAHASVTVYAVWYPNGDNSPPQVAQNGATIGGWFYLRLRVQPQSGYIISASVTQSTLAEQTDVHPVTPTSPTFQSTQPNPAYGDPTDNVVVLQSQQNLADRHNGQYRLDVTVQYTVSTGNPPPNDRQTFTEVASFTFNVLNLLLVDSRAEPYFVWKLDEMSGVVFSAQLQHAQAGTCTVKVEIFRSDDNQNAVVVKEFANVSRPGTWSWTWDGRLDDGTVAPAGVYVYRLGAYIYGSAPPDRDSNRSDYLFIERAVDENNEPMLYAEYWGYDDRETPEDETDDEHLYFIRWYVLKDSLNTNAHRGEIWLFDPELQRIGTWDLAQLPCVEHNYQPDGLTASASGVKHGVLVRVPVSLMVTPGEYLFMVHAVDDHVAREKRHRRKPALPLNAITHQMAVEDIGFYLNANYHDREKLQWDGQDPERPGPCEFAILRQQPGGNTLYIMAHVKASRQPPRNAVVTARLFTSVSDTRGIHVTLRYAGRCADKPNHYHFHRPRGQEIVMTDGPSVPNQRIQVRMVDEGEDVREVTTYDHARSERSTYLDSFALTLRLSPTYQKRGEARDEGADLDIPVLLTMLRYIKAAGVEKITVQAGNQSHTLPVKNQADILYYSGHGYSSSGSLQCLDNGGTFTVSDVAPTVNWREDLKYFIIAGCIVLKPDHTNGYAWGNATLKQGILSGLCGYHGLAPSDMGGAIEIAGDFAQMVVSGSAPSRTGDAVLDAWLEANRQRNALGIVYNRQYYWWVLKDLLGREFIDGPNPW